MKRIICLILTLSLLVCCTSCGSKKDENKPKSVSFKCFDTVCSLTIYDKMTNKDFKVVSQYFKDLCKNSDENLSKTNKESFVSKINKEKTLDIYDKDADIVNKSIQFSKDTKGAFDITISPIVDLWNITDKDFTVPKEQDINKALKLVDYKQIKSDSDIYTLKKKGSIDLGAIAKGFVTDDIVKELKTGLIKSAIVDLGGNIYAHGSKNGSPFRVGIKKPFGNGKLSAIVKVKNKAVITSGIYQRYKKVNGKIYSHIMNPKTGKPINNDLYSVTVISDSGTTADALSTATMVMGLKKGMNFVNNRKDIEAVFIDKNNKLHLSKGLIKKGNIITIK